ncbi:MAG: mycofactocin biosynthesis chaperone MftB [Desulfomonilaceae bacterium]|nr:mycofactocin biosynthesis chaperone MftB [Desulfomonilaceae bacterium]
MRSEVVYNLWDGVQVRREKFGLLFYDYRGPRLHFLPSRDLLAPEFFQGRRTAAELVEAIRSRKGLPQETASRLVTDILGMLREKGLIYEQSIC